MRRAILFLTTGLLLSGNALAGQLTIGDWDFIGLPCFPGTTVDWEFTVEPIGPVTIVEITIWDWGQYDVVYSGGGLMLVTLTNCNIGGTLGAQFEVDVPDDIFNHYLPEVVVEMPATFCDFCGSAGFEIDLVGNRFELISSPWTPTDLPAQMVFGDLATLLIAYADDGGYYLPGSWNGIGDFTPVEGYRLFCSADETLLITGDLLPAETVYTLTAGLWNWLGYPFEEEVPVDIALADITDQVIIVQNDDGLIWIPGEINTLGNMVPGEGYQVVVSSSTSFIYHPWRLIGRSLPVAKLDIAIPADAPRATGLPWNILFRLSDELLALNPHTISIFAGGLLVGKGYVQHDYSVSPVTCWEGAPEYGLAGFTIGDPAMVVLQDEAGQPLSFASRGGDLLLGQGAWGETHLGVRAQSSISVLPAYPNPFNPTMQLPFELTRESRVTIGVVNILGQQVYSHSAVYSPGVHHFTLDADQADLVNGMYFLQVSSGQETAVQKIVLLK